MRIFMILILVCMTEWVETKQHAYLKSVILFYTNLELFLGKTPVIL
jgi:hypothetical protein